MNRYAVVDVINLPAFPAATTLSVDCAIPRQSLHPTDIQKALNADSGKDDSVNIQYDCQHGNAFIHALQWLFPPILPAPRIKKYPRKCCLPNQVNPVGFSYKIFRFEVKSPKIFPEIRIAWWFSPLRNQVFLLPLWGHFPEL